MDIRLQLWRLTSFPAIQWTGVSEVGLLYVKQKACLASCLEHHVVMSHTCIAKLAADVKVAMGGKVPSVSTVDNSITNI